MVKSTDYLTISVFDRYIFGILIIMYELILDELVENYWLKRSLKL